jgi:hypothetical protein
LLKNSSDFDGRDAFPAKGQGDRPVLFLDFAPVFFAFAKL